MASDAESSGGEGGGEETIFSVLSKRAKREIEYNEKYEKVYEMYVKGGYKPSSTSSPTDKWKDSVFMKIYEEHEFFGFPTENVRVLFIRVARDLTLEDLKKQGKGPRVLFTELLQLFGEDIESLLVFFSTKFTKDEKMSLIQIREYIYGAPHGDCNVFANAIKGCNNVFFRMETDPRFFKRQKAVLQFVAQTAGRELYLLFTDEMNKFVKLHFDLYLGEENSGRQFYRKHDISIDYREKGDARIKEYLEILSQGFKHMEEDENTAQQTILEKDGFFYKFVSFGAKLAEANRKAELASLDRDDAKLAEATKKAKEALEDYNSMKEALDDKKNPKKPKTTTTETEFFSCIE